MRIIDNFRKRINKQSIKDINPSIILFGGGQSEAKKPYYHYCHDWLQDFFSRNLTNRENILFISWAIWGGHDADKMFSYGQEHWGQFGLNLKALHKAKNMTKEIEEADAIIVGGGSVHMLVRELENNRLMMPLRKKIESGCLYIGTSAGSVICGPTMHTASEPPLIHIPSHKTLGVVPFQINAHYYDNDPDAFHHGPTPATRLKNYLLLNPNPKPVVCIRDGSYLRINGGKVEVMGIHPVTVFGTDMQRYDFSPGSYIDSILDTKSVYYQRGINSSLLREHRLVGILAGRLG